MQHLIGKACEVAVVERLPGFSVAPAWGPGFGIQGLGFRLLGSGFRV